MEKLFRNPRAIGITLDLSLRSDKDGKRFIDTVKKGLVGFVRTMEDDDLFYIYQPNSVELFDNRGAQIAAVGNCELDGSKIDLNYALKQTLYVIAAEPAGSDRFVVLITDRFSERDKPALKKILMLNQKDGYECHCLVIGVGSCYSSKVLKEVCEESPQANYLHLTNTASLSSTLTEWITSSI